MLVLLVLLGLGMRYYIGEVEPHHLVSQSAILSTSNIKPQGYQTGSKFHRHIKHPDFESSLVLTGEVNHESLSLSMHTPLVSLTILRHAKGFLLRKKSAQALGYKTSFSTQLSMKFFLLINVKMPKNVGIFNIYEQEK